MITYVIYNVQNGNITRWGIDPNPDRQVRPGEALLPDPAQVTDPRLQRVVDGEVVAWQPPAPPADEWQTWLWSDTLSRWVSQPTAAGLARDVRAERNRRADAYNGVVARAYRLGEPIPAAVATYLQALADVPQQPGFPSTVTWPEEPAA